MLTKGSNAIAKEDKPSQLKAKPEAKESARNSLYMLGGVAALIALLAYICDFGISFAGGDTQPGMLAVSEWFGMFRDSPVLALRNLGLLNMISVTMAVPLYCALYAAHRRTNRDYAALAMSIYVIGAAIYISNNAALPMMSLSVKHMAAISSEQQAYFAAAGEALLVRGEDFTPGSFIGFFFTEVGGLLISLVMLYGRIFSRATAYTGIVGFALLCVFTVWATFIPHYYQAALLLAMVGGLCSLAWYAMTAKRLFGLER